MILKNKRDNFQPEFECMNVYTPKIKKDTKSVEIQGNMTIYGGHANGNITAWKIDNQDGYVTLKLIKTMLGHK